MTSNPGARQKPSTGAMLVEPKFTGGPSGDHLGAETIARQVSVYARVFSLNSATTRFPAAASIPKRDHGPACAAASTAARDATALARLSRRPQASR